MEVRVCVGGERDVVVRFGPVTFKSDGSAGGGEGDQDHFWFLLLYLWF